MKKKTALVLVIILAFLLASCGGNMETEQTETIQSSSPAEVRYATAEASWSFSHSAEQLTERSDVVFSGTITDISFQVLDATTAMPPDEKTIDRNRWLHTAYDVDVITVYKGNVSNPARISIEGGVRDYRVEEQLALMKEMRGWHDDCIFIHSGMPEIKIGETYLFALKKPTVRDVLIILNPYQSIYHLQNPFKKNGISGYELDSQYYSSQTDQHGYPIISAKDIISVFGQDKWDAFWAQWQKDNPDWESRLDKAAVEKALTAN